MQCTDPPLALSARTSAPLKLCHEICCEHVACEEQALRPAEAALLWTGQHQLRAARDGERREAGLRWRRCSPRAPSFLRLAHLRSRLHLGLRLQV